MDQRLPITAARHIYILTHQRARRRGGVWRWWVVKGNPGGWQDPKLRAKLGWIGVRRPFLFGSLRG